jgi:hypothetical protein
VGCARDGRPGDAAGGLGGAAPADAAVLRLGLRGADVNVGLSLNGGLQLTVGARVGFNQSNWNGDDKGETEPDVDGHRHHGRSDGLDPDRQHRAEDHR